MSKNNQTTKISLNNSSNKEKGVYRRMNIQASPHGGVLVDMLYREAILQCITFTEMAKAVGVTYGYINQLNNGIRSTKTISKKFVSAISQFLAISPIAVRMAAGQISIDDFNVPIISTETAINKAIGKILNDPKIGQSISSQLSALPKESKLAVIEVYMQTTGIDVLELSDSPIVLNKIMSYFESQK